MKRVGGWEGGSKGDEWMERTKMKGVDRINPQDQFMQNQPLQDQLSLENNSSTSFIYQIKYFE